MMSLFGHFEMVFETFELVNSRNIVQLIAHDNQGSQRRMETTQKETNYPLLHDTARHATHSSKTLTVAEKTIQSMIRQHHLIFNKLTSRTSAQSTAFPKTHEDMEFQLDMLKSLNARSHPIEA